MVPGVNERGRRRAFSGAVSGRGWQRRGKEGPCVSKAPLVRNSGPKPQQIPTNLEARVTAPPAGTGKQSPVN